jgi:mannose-1-phosphate guanylyltransferase/phosphomannomutase
MKAMLLAAGRGERLSPITRILPKPLLPVLGRPLAPWVLTQMAAEGVDDAVINLHHLPQSLREALGDGSTFGLRSLRYSLEPRELLGTGGGIVHAAAFLRGSGPIVVRNSDFLADIPLADVVAFHERSGRGATLVLAPHRAGYTRVRTGAGDTVQSFGGDAGGDFLFTGCQVIDEELIDRLPVDRPSDIVRDLYVELAAEGQVAAYVHEGFWWEFGTPDQYLEGSRTLMELPTEVRLEIGDFDPVRAIGGVPAAVGAGVVLHGDGIQVAGFVVAGLGVHVEEDVRLEDTIVMPEAWIGPSSSLRRCIVGPGTEVPAGFTADHALLASDLDRSAPAPAGCERRGGLLVRTFGGAAAR